MKRIFFSTIQLCKSFLRLELRAVVFLAGLSLLYFVIQMLWPVSILRTPNPHYLNELNFKDTNRMRALKPRKDADSISRVAQALLGYEVMPDQCRRNANLPDKTLAKFDLMKEGPFQLLSDYRNPCWWRQTDGSNELRCWPSVYLAGFPKCSTTDLFYRIMIHPAVIAPGIKKEPQWLTRKRFSGYTLDQYTETLARQVSTQPNGGKQTILVDGSICTMWDNHKWRRLPGNEQCLEPRLLNPDFIRHLNPGARILVLLRNPTTRAHSEYLFKCHRCPGRDPHVFHHLMEQNIEQFKSCLKTASLRTCVYDEKFDAYSRLRVGMYSVFVEDWLLRYPREEMLFLRLEDERGMAHKLHTVFNFLGVAIPDNDTLQEMLNLPKRNVGRKKPGPMLNKTKALLDDLYRPFNARLAQILQDRRFTWEDV